MTITCERLDSNSELDASRDSNSKLVVTGFNQVMFFCPENENNLGDVWF